MAPPPFRPMVVMALAMGLGGPALGGLLPPADGLPEAGRGLSDVDAEGGQVLPGALRVEAGAGARRLDLLLDLQRDAATQSPPVERRGPSVPAGRSTAPPNLPVEGGNRESVQTSATLRGLRDALHADDAAASLAGIVAGHGENGDGETRRRMAEAAARGGEQIGAPTAGSAATGVLSEELAWALNLPRLFMDFAREHLGWLISGAAALVVLAGVVRLADRRV